MYWLWNDGSQDRSGIQLVQFQVQRIGVSVSGGACIIEEDLIVA